jgi:hypothetical protein
MRVRHAFGLALAALLGLGPEPARASFVMQFDEFGNGFINQNNTGFQRVLGTLLPDPTQVGNPLVLSFLLPEAVVTGDLRVFDDANRTMLGDLLRFTDAAGQLSGALSGAGSRMIFYSAPDEADVPAVRADTGFPALIVPRDEITLPSGEIIRGTLEAGPEGANGFTWSASTTLAGGPANLYIGISDGVVPEPSSLALLGIGMLAALGLARRRAA